MQSQKQTARFAPQTTCYELYENFQVELQSVKKKIQEFFQKQNTSNAVGKAAAVVNAGINSNINSNSNNNSNKDQLQQQQSTSVNGQLPSTGVTSINSENTINGSKDNESNNIDKVAAIDNKLVLLKEDTQQLQQQTLPILSQSAPLNLINQQQQQQQSSPASSSTTAKQQQQQPLSETSEIQNYFQTKMDYVSEIMEDMFGKLTELMNDSHKDKEIYNLKREIEQNQRQLFEQKEDIVQMKEMMEQQKVSYKLKKKTLKKDLKTCQQQLTETRNSVEMQREEMAQVIGEQKKLQKKMEHWFTRRMEKLELLLLDKRDDQLQQIIMKVKKFKKNMPWKRCIHKNNHISSALHGNGFTQQQLQQQQQPLQMQPQHEGSSKSLSHSSKCQNSNHHSTSQRQSSSANSQWRTQPQLQQQQLQSGQHKQCISDGSSTPFTNYSEFEASENGAESLDKTINKGFIVSNNTSACSTTKNKENNINNNAYLNSEDRNCDQQQQHRDQLILGENVSINNFQESRRSLQQLFISTQQSHAPNSNQLNLSVSQLEQLMLNYLQRTDLSNNTHINQKDVQLEDLLNVTQNNSLSLDNDNKSNNNQMNNNNNGANNQKCNNTLERLLNSFTQKSISKKFNQKLKFKDIKENFPQNLSPINSVHCSLTQNNNNNNGNSSLSNILNMSIIESAKGVNACGGASAVAAAAAQEKKNRSTLLNEKDRTNNSCVQLLKEIAEEIHQQDSPSGEKQLNKTLDLSAINKTNISNKIIFCNAACEVSNNQIHEQQAASMTSESLKNLFQNIPPDEQQPIIVNDNQQQLPNQSQSNAIGNISNMNSSSKFNGSLKQNNCMQVLQGDACSSNLINNINNQQQCLNDVSDNYSNNQVNSSLNNAIICIKQASASSSAAVNNNNGDEGSSGNITINNTKKSSQIIPKLDLSCLSNGNNNNQININTSPIFESPQFSSSAESEAQKNNNNPQQTQQQQQLLNQSQSEKVRPQQQQQQNNVQTVSNFAEDDTGRGRNETSSNFFNDKLTNNCSWLQQQQLQHEAQPPQQQLQQQYTITANDFGDEQSATNGITNIQQTSKSLLNKKKQQKINNKSNSSDNLKTFGQCSESPILSRNNNSNSSSRSIISGKAHVILPLASQQGVQTPIDLQYQQDLQQQRVVSLIQQHDFESLLKSTQISPLCSKRSSKLLVSSSMNHPSTQQQLQQQQNDNIPQQQPKIQYQGSPFNSKRRQDLFFKPAQKLRNRLHNKSMEITSCPWQQQQSNNCISQMMHQSQKLVLQRPMMTATTSSRSGKIISTQNNQSTSYISSSESPDLKLQNKQNQQEQANVSTEEGYTKSKISQILGNHHSQDFGMLFMQQQQDIPGQQPKQFSNPKIVVDHPNVNSLQSQQQMLQDYNIVQDCCQKMLVMQDDKVFFQDSNHERVDSVNMSNGKKIKKYIHNSNSNSGKQLSAGCEDPNFNHLQQQQYVVQPFVPKPPTLPKRIIGHYKNNLSLAEDYNVFSNSVVVGDDNLQQPITQAATSTAGNSIVGAQTSLTSSNLKSRSITHQQFSYKKEKRRPLRATVLNSHTPAAVTATTAATTTAGLLNICNTSTANDSSFCFFDQIPYLTPNQFCGGLSTNNVKGKHFKSKSLHRKSQSINCSTTGTGGYQSGVKGGQTKDLRATSFVRTINNSNKLESYIADCLSNINYLNQKPNQGQGTQVEEENECQGEENESMQQVERQQLKLHQKVNNDNESETLEQQVVEESVLGKQQRQQQQPQQQLSSNTNSNSTGNHNNRGSNVITFLSPINNLNVIINSSSKSALTPKDGSAVRQDKHINLKQNQQNTQGQQPYLMQNYIEQNSLAKIQVELEPRNKNCDKLLAKKGVTQNLTEKNLQAFHINASQRQKVLQTSTINYNNIKTNLCNTSNQKVNSIATKGKNNIVVKNKIQVESGNEENCAILAEDGGMKEQILTNSMKIDKIFRMKKFKGKQ